MILILPLEPQNLKYLSDSLQEMCADPWSTDSWYQFHFIWNNTYNRNLETRHYQFPLFCHCFNLGVPLATLAAQAVLEAPAKNVSVTPMAHCLSPVMLSQGSARADLEPRGRSVMAASTGMHERARSVFVRILT